MTKVLHTDVARTLIEDIRSGRYAVGALLPTEPQLGEMFGTTRYTVRAALAALEELGLISRKKNVGTRVERREALADVQQTLTSVAELAQFGAEHQRQIRRAGEVVADLSLAKQLGCPGGVRWFAIASVRIDGHSPTPVGWTDTYIEPEYASVLKLAKKQPQVLISALIESQFGRRVAYVRQEVMAVSLPADVAKELGAPAGSPALKVIRRYSDVSRKTFEITITHHPAERFVLSMQLKRSQS